MIMVMMLNQVSTSVLWLAMNSWQIIALWFDDLRHAALFVLGVMTWCNVMSGQNMFGLDDTRQVQREHKVLKCTWKVLEPSPLQHQQRQQHQQTNKQCSLIKAPKMKWKVFVIDVRNDQHDLCGCEPCSSLSKFVVCMIGSWRTRDRIFSEWWVQFPMNAFPFHVMPCFTGYHCLFCRCIQQFPEKKIRPLLRMKLAHRRWWQQCERHIYNEDGNTNDN